MRLLERQLIDVLRQCYHSDADVSAIVDPSEKQIHVGGWQKCNEYIIQKFILREERKIRMFNMTISRLHY